MTTIPKTLKQRMLRAGKWTIAGHGLSQVIRLGSNLVMTRLLIPEMFGVMAIVITINMVANMFSDIGLRQNIIQSSRGEEPEFLNTAWMMQIGRGIVLCVFMLLISIGFHFAGAAGYLSAGSVYSAPVLPFLIAVYSISPLISGFQSTKMATAHRNFEQKRLSQIALVSQVAGLFIMIIVGIMSRSIWALVAGGLISSLLTTVLSHTWMSGQSNKFHYDKKALGELFNFGKWVFFSSALHIVTMTGDKLLLGAFVTADVLGYYVIASLFISAIKGTLERFFYNVSLPGLCEIVRTNPEQIGKVYNKLSIPGDLMLIFLAAFLYQFGQGLIALLYDSRYASTGGILQILALSLFAARYEIAKQAYLAMGYPKYVTIISLVRFISLFSLVPILYNIFGVQGAVWGVALHSLAAIPLIYVFNSKLRLIDLRRESIVLFAIPIGYFSGSAMNSLFAT